MHGTINDGLRAINDCLRMQVAEAQRNADRLVAMRRGWSGPLGMFMEGDGDGGGSGGSGGDGGGGAGGGQADPPEATDDQGRGLGFPKDTPVEKMTVEQTAAYWRNQSRVQERRSAAWAETFAGKKPEEVKAAMDELAAKTQTEQEQALERARQEALEQGKTVGATSAAEETAMLLLESYLENREVDEDRRKILLTTVDPKRGLGEDGKVSADRVKAIAEALAPKVDGRSGGGSRTSDVGAGRRLTSVSSGMAAGRELFEERHGRKREEA